MLETCGPQGAVGHVAASDPAPARRRGPETQNTCSVRAHLSQEAKSRVIGYVAAPEPTSTGRRCSEPTRGSAGAHLSQEVRSGAI
jgi:hypothetical protein